MKTAINNIIEKLSLAPKRVAGVEAVLSDNGIITYTATILNRERGALYIEKKSSQLTTLATLKEFLNEEIPLALTINGRGIISTKLNTSEENHDKILQTILPNAKTDDFYFQIIKNTYSSFIAIARKQTVDLVISQLGELNFKVTSCTLGPFASVSLLPFIESNTFIYSGQYELEKNETDLKSFKISGEKKQNVIGDELIDAEFLPSYASAFQYLAGGHENVEIELASLQTNRDDVKHKKLFKILSIGLLVFFFVTLLVNFILFSIFSDANNELTLKQSNIVSLIGKEEELKKDIQIKESFLSEAGWLKSSRAAFYADRIAATVPDKVELTELSIYPLDEKESRKSKKHTFYPSQGRIAGLCSKPEVLNIWFTELKKIEGIKDVRMGKYFFDNKTMTGTFELTIDYNL
ncbi:MAG TPA: hypothetical protein VF691_02515 [Cytophagaceae bacterium]|jgi:hypothetical protein